ncbi:MAG: HAD-IA family hydrolase [Hyphomicrobium sp.]
MNGWTLVFDLDGTLVDTAPDLAAATSHVLSRYDLPPVDQSDIRAFVGHGALAMIQGALKAHGRVLNQDELMDQFEVFLTHYAANIANTSRPYPGVVRALEAFAGQGALLAVCTNKIELHARLLLDALDLTRHFAAITGRDSLGASKPDPRHLTGTIALAKGTATRAVMIGDSETDIATAKAARIPVVAVDFGYSIEPVALFEPDAIISHFDELELAVQRLAGVKAFSG